MFALWKRYRHVAAVAPLMLATIATASAQAPYPTHALNALHAMLPTAQYTIRRV